MMTSPINIRMNTIIGKEPIDLELSLMESAQCFHWVKAENCYGAVINGRPVWIWQENGCVMSDDGADVGAIRAYLDLDRDYSGIADEYARFEKASQVVRMYPGLRVLNQPTWETLISFIISANNNVGRIRGLVMKILTGYGQRLETERGALYAFPDAERLAQCTVDELHALGLGYRDKYIVETSKAVAGGFPLDEMRAMEYEAAHKQLLTLMGVGDKVADCVQLFGCGHSEAFPVDVWIARMVKVVFGMEGDNRRQVGKDARKMLGKDAGILQQFLFHASRTGALEV
jgi:N-glycosylase/DNA lyase